MFNRSELVGELMAALAKAQGEFPVIKKESKNYYGGLYAELDAIVDAVRPALSKNGIAFYHIVGSDLDRRTASVTTYLQLGEQWISDFAEVSAVNYAWDKEAREKVERFDAQTISGAWTYFKRTTLQAITGAAAETDDDAQGLVGNNKPIPAKPFPSQNSQQAPQSTQKPADSGVFKLVGDRLTCVPLAVEEKKGKNGPYLTVTWNGKMDGLPFGYCYDTKFHDALKLANGLECQIKLKKTTKADGDFYFTIADVFSVNGIEYKDGVPNNEFNQEVPNDGN